MKKRLLAFGTFLTTLALFGCSGTPQGQATLGTTQSGNTLDNGSSTGQPSPSQSTSGGSSTNSAASSATNSAANAAKAPVAIKAKTVRIGSIDWFVDYDQALAYAKQTNKPLWLHFGENPG